MSDVSSNTDIRIRLCLSSSLINAEWKLLRERNGACFITSMVNWVEVQHSPLRGTSYAKCLILFEWHPYSFYSLHIDLHGNNNSKNYKMSCV